jgi:hypothetical protein
MARAFWRVLIVPILLAAGGCSEGTNVVTPDKGPPEAGRPPGEGAEAAPVADVTTAAGTSPTIKQIMTKLTKGPTSLTPVIGQELETENPPWETIQAQTKEFAQLASAMGQNDPPKGHKESWEKLTSAFAEWASDLDKAAQAKNKDDALEAHGKLAGSCMACHREHRQMGRGMMGGPMGMPPGMPPGGPRPGGGPPGGPPRRGPAPK